MKDKMGGELKFFSKEGVPSSARNFFMNFSFSSAGHEKTTVQLVMEYETLNPLVTAATPFLNADNNLALKSSYRLR